MELPLPEAVRLEEEIARTDGSLGWVVTLCAGAGWFAGFLPEAKAKEIVTTPQVSLAGSGAATGFADKVPGGYHLSGEWAHASGAPWATHFTGNAVIREDGKPMLTADGLPVIRAFVFDAAHVELLPSWSPMGMRATASKVYRVKGCHVNEDACFELTPGGAVHRGPLYRYPFLQLAEVTLAANLSGMALHFLELAQPLIMGRRSLRTKASFSTLPAVTSRYDKAAASVADSRLHFYHALENSWNAVVKGAAPSYELLTAVSATSQDLVDTCRRAVDELYPLCGLYAADPEAEINLVWRDFHTATQHALLSGF